MQGGIETSPLGDYLLQIRAATAARDGTFLAELLDPLVAQSAIDPLLPELRSGNVDRIVNDTLLGAAAGNGHGGNSNSNSSRARRRQSGDSSTAVDPTIAAMVPVATAFCDYLATDDTLSLFPNLLRVVSTSIRTLVAEDWFAPVIATLLQALAVVGQDRDSAAAAAAAATAAADTALTGLAKVPRRRAPAKCFNEIHSVITGVMSRLLLAAGQQQQGGASRSTFTSARGDTLTQPPAAVLPVANIALRFYQRIGEVQLSTKLLSQIASRKLALDAYPISQLVVFHFFAGRHDLMMHKFRSAEAHLSFAFLHTRRDYVKQKRIALTFLIVARMVRGVFPAKALLDKYGLSDTFSVLIYSVKMCSWSKFMLVLQYNQNLFAGLGVYYILQQRVKRLMLRGLVQKLHRVKQELDPSGNGAHAINVNDFAIACKCAGLTDVTPLAAESILISLISQGWIKGYVMQGRMLLVLSKNEPFPAISSLN